MADQNRTDVLLNIVVDQKTIKKAKDDIKQAKKEIEASDSYLIQLGMNKKLQAQEKLRTSEAIRAEKTKQAEINKSHAEAIKMNNTFDKNVKLQLKNEQSLMAMQSKRNQQNLDMETKLSVFQQKQLRNLENAKKGKNADFFDSKQLAEFESKVKSLTTTTPNLNNKMTTMSSEFENMKNKARLASVELENNRSMFDKLGSSMAHNFAKFTEFMLAGTLLMSAIHGIGDAINFTVEQAKNFSVLQMELTNQKLVYEDVITKSNEYAESVGSTTSAISEAIGIFSVYTDSLENAMEKSKDAAVLSNISGQNIAESADNIQAAMQQFELADDAGGRIVDVYAGTARMLSVDYPKALQELANGVKNVGSVSQTQGVSLEKTSGMIGTIIEKTRKSGAEAGNALNLGL